jgi:calcineurin-like phosphoesterase family protein
MSDIWIISDTHFGHANMLRFKDSDGAFVRSNFDSADHMDEHMIEQWNSVVKDGDIVYHLGDVYFDHGHNALSKLKGRKRLILGNHDNAKSSYLQNNFQKILMWRMFPEFGLLLTHVPVHESSLGFKVNKNVHGHLHQRKIADERYVNVSVECINYTPVHIDHLRVI